MTITQPKRLSYTRRDLLSLHDDVSKYMKEFIPRIKDTSEMNPGRLFLTIIEAMIDNLNYSVDNAFLELSLKYAKQRKNILRTAYMLGYDPNSAASASVDATVSLQSGVAGAGGYAIAAYQRFQTTVSPLVEFFAPEPGLIDEGDSSTILPVVQGVRVVGEELAASSSGELNQSYSLSNVRTPHSLVEVYVDSVKWERVENFWDSDEEAAVFRLEFDDDDYTSVVFGDDKNGKSPDAGTNITATYVYCAGEQGNVIPGALAKVVGTPASDLLVTNVYAASGGAESESSDSIKDNAPGYRASRERAVTRGDYESVAKNVEGVYNAYAMYTEGVRTYVYIMPEGGGVASSYLLDQVQQELDSKKMDGAIPSANALAAADIRIHVNAITFNNRIQKSIVKRKIYDAIVANLEYTELTLGRGFTISDLAGVLEAVDDGKLIDFVDFVQLTRVPRIQKSNASAPDFVGEIKLTENTGYDTYVITAVTTTEFYVAKNGTPQAEYGDVNTEYTTSEGEITFTLGESGDTFTVGDIWIFKTSKYADNILIDGEEFMQLASSGDLVMSVYYPGEYDVATKSEI